MSPLTRKTLLIMIAIMVVEGYPMALTLEHASPTGVLRLYTAPLVDDWPAWIAAGAVAAGYIVYAVNRMPTIGARFFEPHPLKLLAIPFALISGTMEELWFRRAGMDWAQGLGAGLPMQIAGSAILFGLAHGVWGLFARRWRVAVNSVAATTVLGAALAAVYVLGDRQVAPCIWAHTAINLAIEPWLLIAAMKNAGTRPAQPATDNTSRSPRKPLAA